METTTLQAKKYALVTGAASGMGRYYALRLAERGYALVVVDCQAIATTLPAEVIQKEKLADVVVEDFSEITSIEQLG